MATNMLQLPEELVTEIFNKVNGHSSIAKLSAQKPLPFNGEKEFVFTMPGEASIVAEGTAKPDSGNAVFTPVVIRPLKFVYQTRITDEFLNSAEEAQLNYLKAFGDGFAVKIARALDIASMHGLNPATSAAVAALATNCFDGAIQNTVTYAAASADDNLDKMIELGADVILFDEMSIKKPIERAFLKVNPRIFTIKTRAYYEKILNEVNH